MGKEAQTTQVTDDPKPVVRDSPQRPALSLSQQAGNQAVQRLANEGASADNPAFDDSQRR